MANTIIKCKAFVDGVEVVGIVPNHFATMLKIPLYVLPVSQGEGKPGRTHIITHSQIVSTVSHEVNPLSPGLAMDDLNTEF